MRKHLFNFALILLGLALAHCEGDSLCGATVSPGADADSDCVTDDGDNCPFLYNPAQVDVDENEIGDSCEAAPAPAFQVFTPDVSDDQDCDLKLVDCDGVVMAIHDERLIANPNSSCSALNPEATNPPELWCFQTEDEFDVLEPVTLNTDFLDAISPCDVFAESLDLSEWCE